MDTTAAPGESFYQYATGGWQQANPLRAEYSRYGSFDKLAEQNIEQIHGLIETISQCKAGGRFILGPNGTREGIRTALETAGRYDA